MRIVEVWVSCKMSYCWYVLLRFFPVDVPYYVSLLISTFMDIVGLHLGPLHIRYHMGIKKSMVNDGMRGVRLQQMGLCAEIRRAEISLLASGCKNEC